MFAGLGTIGDPYSISLRDNASPVIHPPRKVPFSVKKKLEKTLNEMVTSKIIAPITEPTDWVSSIVIIEKKNGSLRICLDPKHLNDAMKRPHYPT